MAAVVVLHDTEECHCNLAWYFDGCVLPQKQSLLLHKVVRMILFFFFFVVVSWDSCFILKLCPHVSGVAFQFLPLCDFSSFQHFSVPFPHLSFSRLTPPVPHPLVSVCVCVCVDKVFEFLHVFPLASSTVSQLGMFPIFVPCVFNGFLLCFCLSSFVSTLSFGHFDSFLVFLDSRFCIISLISLIKLVLSVNDNCILAVSRMKRNPQWGKKLH